MISRTFKLFALLSAFLILQGCRLAIIVVEGGEVRSTASGICVANSICIVDVSDPTFSETFTAVPDEGWYFQKWNSGDRFFCGDNKYPDCTLSFEGHEEREDVKQMVESSELFYLMPVFREGVNSVEVEGREWLQPYDFRGYGYERIAAVCSPDNGLCSGTLPGSSIDLTGYYWASVSDIEGLFISYGAEPPFTAPFPSSPDGEAEEKFCRDFLPTYSGREEDVIGYLRGSSRDSDGYNKAQVLCGAFFVISSSGPGDASPSIGAWFWRSGDQ